MRGAALTIKTYSASAGSTSYTATCNNYDQENALSILWHEVTHNRHKLNHKGFSQTRSGQLKQRQMEIANELVSRNSLPEFFKHLGGELQHKKLLADRPSTAYNSWVRNYQHLVEVAGAEKKKVVRDVQQYLLNEEYDTQVKGLQRAISNNSDMKFKNKTIVKECFKKAIFLEEDDFKTFIRQHKDKLK